MRPQEGRRTGVYGGTFNPIHRGHVHILREFIARLSLERVLLIPAGVPPHKQARHLAAARDRVAMCKLAAEEVTEAVVEVSTIELDRPGKSYTSDTLAALKERYPQDEFFLLMGEDMFLTVDRWHEAGKIMELASLCASPRSPDGLRRLREKRKELEALGARCFVEDIPFLDVSSTKVRELAGVGASRGGLARLVPDAVSEYIIERHIYTGGVEDEA